MRALAVLALFLIGIPSAVTADPLRPYTSSIDWDYQCSVGQVFACISLAAKLEYDPGAVTGWGFGLGATTVTVTFANLQGSGIGPFPDSEPWRFHAAWIRNLWTDVPYGSFGDLVSDVTADRPVDFYWNGTVEEGPSAYWEHYAFTDSPNFGGGPSVEFFGQNNANSLYGCDTHEIDWDNVSRVTFFEVGCNATLSISWIAPGRWAFTDATVATWQGFAGNPAIDMRAGPVVGCTIGIDCVSVPEPATWIMIMTGLAGLVMIERRRSGEAPTGSL